MPAVPAAILRSRFAPAAALLSTTLRIPALVESLSVVRYLIFSTGALLRAQEPSAAGWGRPALLRLFHSVLDLAVDPRPKARKAAQKVIVDLLRDHSKLRSEGVASLVTAYCSNVLSACAGVASADSGAGAGRGASAAQEDDEDSDGPGDLITGVGKKKKKKKKRGIRSAREARENDIKKAQQLLGLLRACLQLFPPSCVSTLCNNLLQLVHHGKSQSAILTYRFLTELAKRAQSPLRAEFLATFVGQLVDGAPDVADYVGAAEYPFAIAACMKRLHMLEAGAADDDDDGSDEDSMLGGASSSSRVGFTSPGTAAVLPRVVAQLVEYLESDRPAVFRSAATSLATILYYCLDRSIVREAMRAAAGTAGIASTRRLPIAARIAATLESVLAFRCQLAWRVAIPTLAVPFSCMGRAAGTILRKLVLKLVQTRVPLARATAIGAAAADVEDDRSLRKLIREDKVERSTAASAELRREIERVLGVAISSMGPAAFLSIVPLDTPAPGAGAGPGEGEPAASGVHVDKDFLLPLLKTYVRYCRPRLGFFSNTVLLTARKCLLACATARTANDVASAKAHERRLLALWALFPSFCVAPVDIATVYNAALGKTLVAALNDARFHRLKTSVCAGLLNLLRRSHRVVVAAESGNDLEDDAVGASEWKSTGFDSRTTGSKRSYTSRRSARSAATSITRRVFKDTELDAEVLEVIRGPAVEDAELPEIPLAEARANVKAISALAPVRACVCVGVTVLHVASRTLF